MRMKSITKRLRKIRSSGRKTQHSNRLRNTKQNKSRKKIMKGGVFGRKSKYAVAPDPADDSSSVTPAPDSAPDSALASASESNGLVQSMSKIRARASAALKRLTSPKWECSCKFPSDDGQIDSSSRLLQESTNRQVTGSSRKSASSTPLRKSLARLQRSDSSQQQDGITGLNSNNLTFGRDQIILSGTQQFPLPTPFYYGDVITKINGHQLDINPDDKVKLNVNKFKELTKGAVGSDVEFTITNDRGGTLPNNRKFSLQLIRPVPISKRGVVGGRKTTYRRKKHVRRNSKSHNKKRMVGGTIPMDVWKVASAEDKLNYYLIDSQSVDDLSIADLDQFISYEQQIHPADQEVLKKLNEIKDNRFPNVQPDKVSPESSDNNTKSLICKCTRKKGTKEDTKEYAEEDAEEYTSNQML